MSSPLRDLTTTDLGQLVYGGIVAVGEPGDPLFDLNNSNTWSDALIFGNGIAGSITTVLHFFSDPFVPQGIQATQTLVGFETDNPDFIQYFSGGTRGANNDYFITQTPEPASTLGFLALGTLGAGATLKRKLKPSKSSEKETTKIG